MYKVISDGTPQGTKVFFNETELKEVLSVTLNYSYTGVTANIEVVASVNSDIEDKNVQIR